MVALKPPRYGLIPVCASYRPPLLCYGCDSAQYPLNIRSEKDISPRMSAPLSFIPWNSRRLWQEANAAVEHHLQRHRRALANSRHAAVEIRNLFASIFPIMDRLCSTTCPDCTDVCCQHACVWIDFKDLLFLHLTGISVPDRQLIDHRGERCRYGTYDGCRLNRLQRPYVCTWYLCPAQSTQLRKEPKALTQVTSSLQQIKQLRLEMENPFLQASLH